MRKQGWIKYASIPGNIGSDEHVREVADACRKRGIPIRIGVNGGSLGKEHSGKARRRHARGAVCKAPLYHVALLEKHDFSNIVISIKSSNVPVMMQAYRLLSAQCSYPLHIGVTEAGTYRMGLIKSAMGIGGPFDGGHWRHAARVTDGRAGKGSAGRL